MKRLIAAVALAMAPMLAHPAAAAEKLKPFILAQNTAADMAATVEGVTARLKAAGFQIAGSYSPYPAAAVIVVTSDALKQAAAASNLGGYGAAFRVAVTNVGGEVQTSYTNPSYMAAAYRMTGDISAPAAQLEAALGRSAEFGMKDGMTKDDLAEYRYMFGMERFSDQITLARHASHQAALDVVETNLAAKVRGVGKVYRIDIPGKQETVFGVAMDGTGGSNQQDDGYIMSEIDFQNLRSTAHLPYEILVSGDKILTLSARFRIAINFPDLSMMGAHSFMNIMGSPDAIRIALAAASGSEWNPLKGQ